MKTTRVFQLTALVLVVISVVTVGWWAIDLRGFIIERTQDALKLHEQEVVAAQALLDAGRSAEDVRKLLPSVTVEGNKAAVSQSVIDFYHAEQQSRTNQYVWESAFFLLALCACIAVISRALRAEARVLQEQDHFLAMVSHQFKTPLASLQLSLETMSMRSLSPTDQRSLIDRMLSDLGSHGVARHAHSRQRAARARPRHAAERADRARLGGRARRESAHRPGGEGSHRYFR